MYEVGTITYSVPDLKGAKVTIIFFGGGGGAMALDDGACGPLLFQKGGIFPTTNTTLSFISPHIPY